MFTTLVLDEKLSDPLGTMNVCTKCHGVFPLHFLILLRLSTSISYYKNVLICCTTYFVQLLVCKATPTVCIIYFVTSPLTQ